MKGTAKYLIVAFITLMSATVANAQPGSTDTTIINNSINDLVKHQGSENVFTVRLIAFSGNKKTKESIMLREIPFKSGEAYPLSELVKKFETAIKATNEHFFIS